MARARNNSDAGRHLGRMKKTRHRAMNVEVNDEGTLAVGYSYATPIAAHVKLDGTTYFLRTTRSYSVTTSSHAGYYASGMTCVDKVTVLPASSDMLRILGRVAVWNQEGGARISEIVQAAHELYCAELAEQWRKGERVWKYSEGIYRSYNFTIVKVRRLWLIGGNEVLDGQTPSGPSFKTKRAAQQHLFPLYRKQAMAAGFTFSRSGDRVTVKHSGFKVSATTDLTAKERVARRYYP